jgi:hypothetical protein
MISSPLTYATPSHLVCIRVMKPIVVSWERIFLGFWWMSCRLGVGRLSARQPRMQATRTFHLIDSKRWADSGQPDTEPAQTTRGTNVHALVQIHQSLRPKEGKVGEGGSPSDSCRAELVVIQTTGNRDPASTTRDGMDFSRTSRETSAINRPQNNSTISSRN